jgi:ParB-like chromosome segregation protein Spo0J
MRSDNDAAIDLERFELRLFPADPPATADILVEERRLPYEPTVAAFSSALSRVVERFGLPERPLVMALEDDGEEEFQVLTGARWIRAAREAGLDRIPVRAVELTDVSGAFLALVLNQQWTADVAAQADALQALLEHGLDEDDLARASGLGRGRLRRLSSLLELHPVLRQALRAGRLKPQVAFAAAGLSPESQEALAGVYEQEGELTGADLRNLPEMAAGDAEADAEPPPANGAAAPADDGGEGLAALRAVTTPEDAAARARRQAEELLRTLEQAQVPGDIRDRVAEVVEQLSLVTV